MQLKTKIFADKNEIFAKDAFNANVGQRTPIRILGGQIRAKGEITEVEVNEDGKWVLITVELDGDKS